MKTVLLGVTGCIAAYKSCEILRGLQKAGVRVKVVMTENATRFVGPATFRALTREPVAVGLFDDSPGDPIHHVSLAQEADLFLIAPCTANVMAKIAHGIADDLLTTTALAAAGPLVLAPAMNVAMYRNEVTQQNMAALRQRGVGFIEAEDGYLACGDTGPGRLADPEAIVASVLEMLAITPDLTGKRVLITAGPTREPIDPVRFISNGSSGKTGFALAEAAAQRGAAVTLVTGPVALGDLPNVETVRVETAQEMFDAVSTRFPEADITIFSAAVCDGRPKEASSRKLKKGADTEALTVIELKENPDILATMGASKRPGQVVVGFAAETEDLETNARKKLAHKGADMIVANLVGDGRGFAADSNEVLLVTADGTEPLPLMDKSTLANEILSRIAGIAGAAGLDR